jgi:hypothetical protein
LLIMLDFLLFGMQKYTKSLKVNQVGGLLNLSSGGYIFY